MHTQLPRSARATMVGALLSAVLFGIASPSAAADPTTLTNGFYADPDSPPLQWANANPHDGRAGPIRESIGLKPMARWFGGWSGSIGTATGAYAGAADHHDKLPIMVAYNIAGRDTCGGHSGGGATTAAEYNTWIAQFAGGISDRPAVVILEPDAVADFGCLNSNEISERQSMLKGAIQQLKSQAPNTWTYLDAGNPEWISATTMARRLHASGLRDARGFSLNISNYLSTTSNADYGRAINAELQQLFGYTKPFVIDTSRNAKGTSSTPWCNPEGQQIGTPTQLGGAGAEMLLWIKTPGESDGDCGVGTGSSAGQFLPEVAYKMIFGL